MQINILFVICLSIFSFVAFTGASSSEDYYLLSLQKCNTSSPWTIHGLWPQWNDCCPGPAFNYSELGSMVSEMNKYWPSCPQYSDTNSQLWSHEWSKHGTCSGMAQNPYFQEAINLLLANSNKCSTSSSATTCQLCFTTSFESTSSSNCASSGNYPNC